MRLDIAGDISTDKEDIYSHSFDWSSFKITPSMIIYPRTREDIKRVIEYVKENKKNDPKLSITCRAAGTDVTGGPLNESIIIDFMRYFDKLEISQGFAHVQPGIFYRDFDKKTREHNLFLPSAPESKDLCALGGMVANNSGGQKTVRYGKTADFVEELKVVLQDGNEYTFKPITSKELDEKKKQDNFEGHIYREMHALLSTYYDKIKEAEPRVSKNSTGYLLWDIWDREREIFDLSKVFVGSQGTLGIITEAKIRLIKPKEHAKIVAIFIPNAELLSRAVQRLLSLEPEALEMYDNKAIKLILKHIVKLTKSLGTKTPIIGVKFLPDMAKFLKNNPEFIVTAEIAEDSIKTVDEKVEQIEKILRELELDYHITRSEEEAEKYHVMRKSSFPVLHGLPTLEPLTLIDDVVVDPARLKDFIPALRNILGNVEYTTLSHVGNGNLHIIVFMDLEDPDIVAVNDKLTHEVNKLVADFNGSISAEHNDGLSRSPFLEMMYGKEMIKCFERTKHIFDPSNIFNPGKKVHSDLKYALQHIRKERPHKL